MGIYSINTLQDSIWQWTVDSRLRPARYRRGSHYTYKYSDMGFYILKKLAESKLNQPIEQFLEQNFYRPLGLSTMTYLPLCKFPQNRIAPTEVDNYFRNTLICGTVHDQGAAMFGGIAGTCGNIQQCYRLGRFGSNEPPRRVLWRNPLSSRGNLREIHYPAVLTQSQRVGLG